MVSKTQFEHLFIVGAGFSQYAGLPLTNNFTKALLDVAHLKLNVQSVLQTDLLKEFVYAGFDHAPNSSPNLWPHLEDLFTCIDLSANTGHHLGPKFAPADLRTVRRALIVRIIRMLQHRYQMGLATGGPRRKTLELFFEKMSPSNSAFLSMNWDTVIEQGVANAHGISSYDYGCDAIAANFVKGGIAVSTSAADANFRILKPHGSSNWLYCDACRDLFWFPAAQTDMIATQLFKAADWDVVKKFTHKERKAHTKNVPCPRCGAQALGTRFATFSYRKALEFPMHGSSWRSAERLLREAKTWIFIGYALPPADYEFKLLLKRVQLSRKRPPKLILITGGDASVADQTQQNYLKFLGPQLEHPGTNVFVDGLEEAIPGLQQLKILKR
jgi:hypothetical protein